MHVCISPKSWKVSCPRFSQTLPRLFNGSCWRGLRLLRNRGRSRPCWQYILEQLVLSVCFLLFWSIFNYSMGCLGRAKCTIHFMDVESCKLRPHLHKLGFAVFWPPTYPEFEFVKEFLYCYKQKSAYLVLSNIVCECLPTYIEEWILEAKTDCYGKDRLFVASFAFCVITFGPIMI